MKYFLFVFGFILFYTSSAQNCVWVKTGGGKKSDYSRTSYTSPNGDTYVVGRFKDTAYFDGNMIFDSYSFQSMYVVKYDINGTLQWLRSATSTSTNSPSYASVDGFGITADNLGNCYIIGSFYGLAKFGSVTILNDQNTSMFVMKYDINGNESLVTSSSLSSGLCVGHDIKIDNSGHYYISGFFQGNMQINSTGLTTTTGPEYFIYKLDPSANPLWAKKTSGQVGYLSNPLTIKLAIDTAGYPCIAGNFYNINSIYFDSYQVTNSSPIGGSDIFISRLDRSNGNFMFAKKLGGTDNDNCNSICSDYEGNFLITGEFKGASVFDTYTLNTTASSEAYISKINSIGNIIWAKQSVSTNYSNSKALIIDANNNSYLAGTFDNNSLFGTYTFTNFGLGIVSYDKNGNVISGYPISINAGNWGGIGIKGNSILIAGYYSNPALIGSSTYTTSGYEDAFLAKIDWSLVSVNEIGDQDSFVQIYPNPTSDFLFIKYNNVNKNLNLVVTDALGKIVYDKTLIYPSNCINISNFSSGNYILTITDGKNKLSKKIIKN